MITGEIMLYPEIHQAQPQFQNYTTHTVTPEWEEKYVNDVERAKRIFSIGDTIIVNNHQKARVTITGFVPDVKISQKYMDNPCVVYGLNSAYVHASPIQYSLPELQMDSLIRVSLPENNDE